MKNVGMFGALRIGWMRTSAVAWLYEPRRMLRRFLREIC
jgi:hypothetical protein